MPFKSIEKRRAWDARYKREVQRPRAKARAAQAKEAARARGEQIVHLNSQGLVVMRLAQTVRVRTGRNEVLTFPASTEVWVCPSDALDLERRGEAARAPEKTLFGARRITPGQIESWGAEPELAAKERTSAGY